MVAREAGVFLDSVVFALDVAHPKDPRTPLTRKFLDLIRRRGVGVTSVYCLAEVAGVMSFVQPPHLLRAFVRYFAPRYGVRLWPTGIFQFDVAAVIERASRRMGAGDATVLWHAETCRPPTSTLVTWNTRDFAGRTNLRLMTPQQYLRG